MRTNTSQTWYDRPRSCGSSCSSNGNITRSCSISCSINRINGRKKSDLQQALQEQQKQNAQDQQKVKLAEADATAAKNASSELRKQIAEERHQRKLAQVYALAADKSEAAAWRDGCIPAAAAAG